VSCSEAPSPSVSAFGRRKLGDASGIPSSARSSNLHPHPNLRLQRCLRLLLRQWCPHQRWQHRCRVPALRPCLRALRLRYPRQLIRRNWIFRRSNIGWRARRTSVSRSSPTASAVQRRSPPISQDHSPRSMAFMRANASSDSSSLRGCERISSTLPVSTPSPWSSRRKGLGVQEETLPNFRRVEQCVIVRRWRARVMPT